MDRKTPIKFAVIPEHEGEAVAYVRERGFESARIERDDNGFVYLVFPPLSDIECGRLAQALPIYLSAKIGFVMNGAPSFSAPYRNDGWRAIAAARHLPTLSSPRKREPRACVG